jgi:hypothetical protein
MISSILLRPLYRHRNAKKLAITTPNGIAEERYVPIGGIDQWLTLLGNG